MEKPFEEIIKNFTSSGDARLDAILKFTVEADQMTGILRRTILTNGSRRENDAEHSWHIALMAMLFKDYA
ncbi:MAG: HD domain-containing protein [Treponemataceae bacterium]|nr:HD domain-containing protein [Treponemataceae bacterium]